MKTQIITKNKIRCKKCGDIIESKYRHNFVTCSCGACSVDGGLDYLRRCGDRDNWEELSEYKTIEVLPKYEVGDKVEFKQYQPFGIQRIVGIIQVVDTFPYCDVVEYDILSSNPTVLYKHIPENDILCVLEKATH